MEAFDRGAREQLGRRVVKDLEKTAPHNLMGLSAVEIDARLRTALEKSEQYSVRSVADLRAFVRLSFIIGPLFADYSAVREKLETSGQGMDRLMAPLFDGMTPDGWACATDFDIVTRAQIPFPFDAQPEWRSPQRAHAFTLDSPSISIEPLASVHADSYFRHALHPDVWKLGRMRPYTSLEQVQAHIRSVSADEGREAYAISHPEAGCVGAITLREERLFSSVAYWVARPFWGHGVATAAVGKLLNHLSRKCHSMSLLTEIARTNVPSIRLVEVLGGKEITPPSDGTCNRIYEFRI
ncbi:GNAT family N-acetyltransferase [Pseudomonas sp. COR58]|uniref:GNAT family N-acetyltransferase n=1 Tax=Pseudomonas ekonensis TaxID=2842353 RepID=A0ABS6PDT8_9PSED|nr:GNAT family N-acetyltransferase [Pseudomonas ekonensis]MBV4458632.1 GNAT family N-acetyltransferase [Pseudomonas ekonensis]